MTGLTPLYRKTLCLIGGGHSHITVIKKLGMRPLPDVKITLINDSPLAPYSGMLPGLIAGHYAVEDCHIDLRKLCQWANVRFICDEVLLVEPQQNRVLCRQYPSLHYDLLSINTGSRPALDTIQGAAQYGHPVKPIKHFLQQWQQWLTSTRDSSNIKKIVVIGAGAAGIEVLLAMHHNLCQTTSVHANFVLICSDQSILQTYDRPVQEFFSNRLDSLGITVICGRQAVAIDEHRLTLDDGTVLDHDFSVWAVHASAQPWLAESGFNCDNRGFIQVDRYLRSISHTNVFAAGDTAAFISSPLPKAGVYAVRQGAILAKNIIAHFSDRSLQPYVPQRYFLSLLTVGDQYAVAARGPLFARGKWVWRWKDYIDRAFIARFSPKPMIRARSDSNEEATMRCGGCGAKISSNILQNVLSQLTIPSCSEIIRGLGDDAAIINIPPNTQWLQSVDFFRSFIEDPFLLGRIAAMHSLSDIYAMGGTPHSALVTAIVPYGSETVMQETLMHLMQGVLTVLQDEKTILIGGHSGEGPEVAIGLTVNGTLTEDKALTKSGLKPGDCLILTKPLGSGVLLAANMAARCKGSWLEQALNYMLQSNRGAASIVRSFGAHGCTDVTGFGLLGHLQEMLIASRCSASLWMDEIPIMVGAQTCSQQGIRSSLYPANKKASQCRHNAEPHPSYDLLFDPQTAGGLLVGIPAKQAAECLDALSAAGYTAAQIGTTAADQADSLIILANSRLR